MSFFIHISATNFNTDHILNRVVANILLILFSDVFSNHVYIFILIITSTICINNFIMTFILHFSDLLGKLAGLSFSSAGFLSFFIATLMSVLDSIGDYSACAKVVRVPQVPKFAFNRGIAVEGLATIVCGSLGCCHATISFGQNVGAIGSTGVKQRTPSLLLVESYHKYYFTI